MTPTPTTLAVPREGGGQLKAPRRKPGMKALLGALALGLAPLAGAHEGHGLGLHHWHASDTLGFVGLAVALGLAWWAIRRK